jgi:hypothetical protein
MVPGHANARKRRLEGPMLGADLSASPASSVTAASLPVHASDTCTRRRCTSPTCVDRRIVRAKLVARIGEAATRRVESELSARWGVANVACYPWPLLLTIAGVQATRADLDPPALAPADLTAIVTANACVRARGRAQRSRRRSINKTISSTSEDAQEGSAAGVLR